MLKIVATPIGNLKDITLRAIEALKTADVIICEDTRETIKLLKAYEIPPKQLLSFYEEVETQKQDEILKLIQDDNVRGVLVSDAGTPLISDPGFKLVRQALRNGIKVEAIPGPTAAITALTISGLPPDKFLFMGYPPEKQSHQKKVLEDLPKKVTVIFYVSPHKITRFLTNLDPNQEIVICRELTKLYEERWSGTVSAALIKFKQPKGEFVVLWHT
ncbi:16S rRNA (cytidine(1402)-2'-O)-methyltransferase [Candidatus Gottesmanbacteria bacterium RIFCSPHIGHO2_01_FULL_42_12]|uniref:Ribosomal RNA small subunit methyltransferase I n=1 Tax=Candidatus Gottesmanbacteria bacterium RIFCSPHIGHO2_01_FULL_42_12 TaxID=1798377 RepID=A0A1F5Z4N4_9BACT|nr:MAG: 16S rRNA (cytidine(1402)-2'-O)-methyltransferase [Candidatus Gottesmanbacteria bacterium RIFCSPHIGHO2_01_FULL_42_12]